MHDITIYTVKVDPNAEVGNRIKVTSHNGWEETRKTYRRRYPNSHCQERELKADMEKTTWRGYMTTDPNKIQEGVKLLLNVLRERAAASLEKAKAEMARVEGAEQEYAAAFNTEVAG